MRESTIPINNIWVIGARNFPSIIHYCASIPTSDSLELLHFLFNELPPPLRQWNAPIFNPWVPQFPLFHPGVKHPQQWETGLTPLQIACIMLLIVLTTKLGIDKE